MLFTTSTADALAGAESPLREETIEINKNSEPRGIISYGTFFCLCCCDLRRFELPATCNGVAGKRRVGTPVSRVSRRKNRGTVCSRGKSVRLTIIGSIISPSPPAPPPLLYVEIKESVGVLRNVIEGRGRVAQQGLSQLASLSFVVVIVASSLFPNLGRLCRACRCF